MDVQEIVRQVRSAIDELTAIDDSEYQEATADEENLEAVIRDKIPYALTYVIEHAPEDKFLPEDLSVLTEGELAGVTVEAGKAVKVKIPSDVLRVVSARLSSWFQSPVPVTESSQEYLMQQDEYARGSWDRPVNAIVFHGEERWLEMYCAKTAADTLEVAFVRKPALPAADAPGVVAGETAGDAPGVVTGMEVKVPVRLEAAFIYQIAGLTMVAFREEVSARLFALADKYLGRSE